MQDIDRALHPVPRNKGKEPIIPDKADALTDDELSSGSSPPLGLSPVKNTRAKSCKRTSHRLAFSNAVNGMSRRARREVGKGQYQPNESSATCRYCLQALCHQCRLYIQPSTRGQHFTCHQQLQFKESTTFSPRP